ncbi:MAG: alanine racemase [Actinomycetota bacterium]
MTHDTWVEVSRDALRANFENVAKHAAVPVCAVVKANAYGHGIAETARIFAEAGAAMLGVSRLDEARAIRAADIHTPILILMPVPDAREALRSHCEVTVGSAAGIEMLQPEMRAHLEIDTGMGRLGVPPSEAVAAAEAVRARATLAAVCTHFADAAHTGRAQLDRFNAVVRALRHHGIECPAHVSNSAGLLTLPDARFDMVRVGNLLYGENPAGARAPWELQATFGWHARVVSVRTLHAGATVGYGSEWKAEREMRVATLPIGWADGFTVEPRPRTRSAKQVARAVRSALTSERSVTFGGRRARVVGRVAMQSTTVSLEGLDEIEVGAAALIPARRLAVSALIERVYV